MNHLAAYALLFLLCLSSCLKDEPLKTAFNSTPLPQNDGWTIGTPAAAGADTLRLQEALDYLFSEAHLPHSKALLIAHRGTLIAEAYSRDVRDAHRLHNIKSITKSLTSVVIGLAIRDGSIDSNLQRTVYSYLPHAFDEDVRKRTITLEHCLRMTTGLTDPFYTVAAVLPDPSLETCLGVDLVDVPGTRHAYNNGSANLLGGVVETGAGLPFGEYVERALFAPLGIRDHHWVRHRDGRVNPAFDLFLAPRDLLRFGQFCLQNGQWEGAQHLPVDWLAQSIQPHEMGFDGAFGYHWWVDLDQNGYYANGHGGQRLWIYPDRHLVMVHLAEPSTDQTDLSEVRTLRRLLLEAF